MANVLVCTSNFNDLCRLCAAKTSILLGLHIFEREGDIRQIFKKITECLPVQVTSTDKLPKMVCEECVYKLDLLFEFREKSLKTESYLTDVLKSAETALQEIVKPVEPVEPTELVEPLVCETVPVQQIQVARQESMKCEPDVFIKEEEGGNINVGDVGSDSESDTESESETDTDSDRNADDGPMDDKAQLVDEDCQLEDETKHGLLVTSIVEASTSQVIERQKPNKYILSHCQWIILKSKCRKQWYSQAKHRKIC